MNVVTLAIQLTAKGLMEGRDYSYLGCDLYTEHGAYGAKTFVIMQGQQIQRFNDPLKAAGTFTILVNKLRRG